MMRTFEPSSTALGRVAMQSPGHGRAPETAPVHQAMAISTSYWHLFPPNNGIHPWDTINTKHKWYLTQKKQQEMAFFHRRSNWFDKGDATTLGNRDRLVEARVAGLPNTPDEKMVCKNGEIKRTNNSMRESWSLELTCIDSCDWDRWSNGHWPWGVHLINGHDSGTTKYWPYMVQ